jgi:hypothetical protein
MALRELFAFALRRERRRRADEQSLEAGALITRRLQELLDGVPTPPQTIETPPPMLSAKMKEPSFKADTLKKPVRVDASVGMRDIAV